MNNNCTGRFICRMLAPAAAMLYAGANAMAQAPEDIRDIRGAKHVASIWLPALLLLAGVILAAGAYAAWRRHRRRKLATALLPFEIALQRLEKAGALMRPDSGREFSIEVSNIVREYIEQRFKVMAAHRTTHEFLHGLMGSADALLSGHRTLLGGFLNQCDLGKFAGWNLSMEDMQTLQRSARSFVIETPDSKNIDGSLPST